MKKQGVILIGEPMALFMARQEGPLDTAKSFDCEVAGAELNVAIGLARLGHKASYMTKLGRDPFGGLVLHCMEQNRIGSELLKYDEALPTGFMLKSLTHHGDPEIFYYRKGSAASTLSPLDLESLDFSEYSILHLTGILPPLSASCKETAFAAVKKARQEGLRITFDPNLRPRLWSSEAEMISTLNELASLSDIVLPGEKEGRLLTGSSDPDAIADFYLNKGVSTVVIKLGSEGAYLATKNTRVAVPGFTVEKVVDTVGAGDGFAAGFLSGLLEGLDLVRATTLANAVGAVQVTVRGDNSGLPTPLELQSFLQTHSAGSI